MRRWNIISKKGKWEKNVKNVQFCGATFLSITSEGKYEHVDKQESYIALWLTKCTSGV